MLTRLDVRDARADLAERLGLTVDRGASDDPAVRASVQETIATVRRDGDAGLRELTLRYDGVAIDELSVTRSECEQAADATPDSVRSALGLAAQRIRRYHEQQIGSPAPAFAADGVTVSEAVLPVDRAGLYVPGGRAAYPSTVLMTAIPARVAGVPERVLCVPPGPDGTVPAVTLTAALLTGVERIFRVGGAQAIAAMAYGTESVPAVDVIVGPGNAYVDVAKRMVSGAGVVGIDGPAGPSELVVVVDDSADPRQVALDVAAQAEHGPGGTAYVVAWDRDVLDAVVGAVTEYATDAPRAAEIRSTLGSGGRAVLVRDAEQAVALANLVAPEHLELMVRDADALGARGPSRRRCLRRRAHRHRRLRRGREPRPADRRGRALRERAAGGRLPDPHARRAVRRRRAPRRRTGGRHAGARGGAGRARRVGRTAARPMSRILPRADLQDLAGYHSPQLDVQIRLNTNESPYPPPAEFVDRWLAALRTTELQRYPDRRATRLREAIAMRVGQPAGRVFAANGSNEVLQTLLLTYGGPGRRALVFEPTYALHSHIARITGTATIVGPRDDDFRIDRRTAVALIEHERPDIVFVCSPNNPSGTVEETETVAALVEAAPGLVVVDEAYGEFATESALDLVHEDRALVVTRTYSKVWSLAALRLGFVVGPAWLVADLEQVVLPYHLDAATQLAGTLALDYADEMQRRVSRLVEDREELIRDLAAMPGIEVFPSGANFVLFRSAGRGRRLWEGLVSRGVLVRDFSSWPGVEDCLRVTVGTPEENARFRSALEETMRESEGP